MPPKAIRTMSEEGTQLHSSFAQFAVSTAFEEGLQQVLGEHEKALRRLMSQIWSNYLEDSGVAWEDNPQRVPGPRRCKLLEEPFQEQAEDPNVERRDFKEQQVETRMPCTKDGVKQDSHVHIDVVTGVQSKTEEPIIQSSDIQESNADDHLNEAIVAFASMRSHSNVEGKRESYIRDT